jgi:hypothetical protein
MNKEYETQDEETTTKQFDINPSTDTHTHNIETTKQTLQNVRSSFDSAKPILVKLKSHLPPIKHKRIITSKSTETLLPLKPPNGFYLADLETKTQIDNNNNNDNNNDFYITANKPTINNNISNNIHTHSMSPNIIDKKYKIIFNELTHVPIWRAAAFMSKSPTALDNDNNKQKSKHVKELVTKTKIRDYINKTRDIILLKQSNKILSQRVKRIEENKRMHCSVIESNIKMLKRSKEQFESQCFDKYNEYIKYLNNKVQDETNINEVYINKITVLKNEIQNIKDAIKVVSEEKNYYIKWITLLYQIKFNLRNVPSQQQHTSLSYLNEYQNKLIFNTYEELNDEMNNLQKKNLSVIQKQNESIMSLEHLRNSKDKINKDLQELIHKHKTEIKECKYNLKQIKQTYMDLIYDKLKYSSSSSNDFIIKDNNNILTLKPPVKPAVIYVTKYAMFINLQNEANKLINNNKHSVYLRKPVFPMKSVLYNKIFNVFTTAMLLQDDKLVGTIEPTLMTSKEMLCEQTEMVLMLEYIEKILIILIKQFRLYMSDNITISYVQMIMKDIDKQNRTKKNQYQKELIKEHEEIRNKKIQDKYKKVLYLPLRKVNKSYVSRLNNMKHKISKSLYNEEPEFNDFMFDINDE